MAYSPAPKAGWPLVCESDRAVALGLAPDYSGYQFQFRGRCKLWLLDGSLPPTTTKNASFRPAP